MATHHIGELRINVEARPGWAPRDAEIRGFTTGVWEAVGDALELRHPGRVYRIRSWEGRWRLTRAALQRRPEATLIDDVVAFCERFGPTPLGVRPDPAADVVCFPDEAERVAAWWLARTTGQSEHWAWRDLERAPSVDAVLSELGPHGTDAAVRCVMRVGGHDQALALLSEAGRSAVLPELDEHLRERAARARTAETTADFSRRPREAAVGVREVWTQWGGLVHLLGPMLECRVVETLWEAGLDERAVLHRALSGLCGEDPLASVLSGSQAIDTRLVDSDGIPEIRTHLVLGLRSAIEQRNLASWPALELVESPRGLAALRARGLPWAVAAWPDGRTASDEAAALGGEDTVSVGSKALWLPAVPRPEDAALLAMVIGVPATLLGLRLGWSGGDADAFVHRWFQRRALLTDNGEVIELRFGAEAVDLLLRRSGSDADPGWIPWLRRKVRLHYDAPEDL